MKPSNAVAFAFAPPDTEIGSKDDSNVFVQVFETAADCRNALACAASDVQVLITAAAGDTDGDISPLNLAAALHKDDEFRDIYLEQNQSGGLLISRAEAAGVRGVVSQGQAKELLGLPESDTETVLSSPQGLEEDLAWLDELINIDELEAAAKVSASGAAVLERPQVFEEPALQPYVSTSPQAQEVTEQSGQGRIAAFVSGRGGVGKSTLALLTAVMLWKSGQRVVLLDLDLQFGDLSYLAGHEAELQLLRLDGGALLQGRIQLPPLGKELLLIESPALPELAEDLVYKVPELLKLLKQTADIVIVNTSCLWNEVLAVLCQNSDKLLFVMDQRSTSIQGCRHAVELCVRLQIPSTRINYLLNRCSRTASITDIDASLAMGGAEIISIADGGAEVDELLSLGLPYELLQADNAFVTSILQLAESLVGSSGLSDKSSAGHKQGASENSGGQRKGFRNGYGFGKSGRRGVE